MSFTPNTQLSQEQVLQSLTQPSTQSIQVTGPQTWSVFHFPSTATQATISKAAGGAGIKHVCNGITVSIAAAGTAQTPIQVSLRDGASGAGTVLWTAALSAPANSCATISISDLNIVGTANTAMTLEFAGAGVAASQAAVSLTGFTTS